MKSKFCSRSKLFVLGAGVLVVVGGSGSKQPARLLETPLGTSRTMPHVTRQLRRQHAPNDTSLQRFAPHRLTDA